MDEAIEDTNQEVQEEIVKEDPEDLTTLNQIQNRYYLISLPRFFCCFAALLLFREYADFFSV
jgi:hypothetical protein